MEQKIASQNIEVVAKQRNLFLVLSLMLGVVGTGITVKMLMTQERIILVPGLAQEVWVSNGGVSKSYLEETSLMHLPLLLDLSPEVIEYKTNLIFKYISQTHPSYMKKIQEYFADSKAKYIKFGLSTYFSVKNFEVDSQKMTVIAHGILNSRYGERGFSTSPASYQLSYEWIGGRLRLKEFMRVKSEQELKVEQEEKINAEKLQQERLRKAKQEERAAAGSASRSKDIKDLDDQNDATEESIGDEAQEDNN